MTTIRPGGAGSGGGDDRSMTTGYSDTTHGMVAQQPMGQGESYNMAELSPYDYGAGAGVAGAAGTAGIQVGAMGLNRARSMGAGNQSQPYGAFAAPQHPGSRRALLRKSLGALTMSSALFNTWSNEIRMIVD